jgi:hypothetical protein
MNVAAKKPFTPAPRMNVLKDQLKEQRFSLITKVKALREQRQALKGVKGSGQQWAELCAQIDEVQDKIDLLSKSLGLPVKERNVVVSPRPVVNPSWAEQMSITKQGNRHQKHSPDGRVNLKGNGHPGLHPDVAFADIRKPTKSSPVGKTDLNHRQNYQPDVDGNK